MFGKNSEPRIKTEFLLQGIQSGFQIIYSNCNIKPVEHHNHKSAVQQSAAMLEELLQY